MKNPIFDPARFGVAPQHREPWAAANRRGRRRFFILLAVWLVSIAVLIWTVLG